MLTRSVVTSFIFRPNQVASHAVPSFCLCGGHALRPNGWLAARRFRATSPPTLPVVPVIATFVIPPKPFKSSPSYEMTTKNNSTISIEYPRSTDLVTRTIRSSAILQKYWSAMRIYPRTPFVRRWAGLFLRNSCITLVTPDRSSAMSRGVALSSSGIVRFPDSGNHVWPYPDHVGDCSRFARHPRTIDGEFQLEHYN